MRLMMSLPVMLIGLSGLSAQAALPPGYQRTAEFKAILESTAVVEAFNAHRQFIEHVEYVKPDLYRVSAGQCVLDVTLKEKPLPDGMVGARQFDLQVGAIDCTAK